MIWSECHGLDNICAISGSLFRLVESQEQVATMNFVDTLQEQALLEEMLEQAKPPYPLDIESFHYLLTTPFRYPPLQWGSRFGRINEPSLFYAGCSQSVTLAESAFYRFIFLNSIEGVTEKDKIRSEHSMFSVKYRSAKGIQLQSPPFEKFRSQLAHPKDYSSAQQLGSEMRAAGIDAFEYASARDPNNDICVALFNTSPFCEKKPKTRSEWLCETTLEQVAFKQQDEPDIYQFPIGTFLLDGSLPMPA